MYLGPCVTIHQGFLPHQLESSHEWGVWDLVFLAPAWYGMGVRCQVEGWGNQGMAEAVPAPGCQRELCVSSSCLMDKNDSSYLQRLILHALKHLIIQWHHSKIREGCEIYILQ